MSALAKTASISLLTALPGSGKSLRLVTWIKAAFDAGEVVYVADDLKGDPGIKGLKVPHIRFPDPREWRDIPPGSVLVVDEAQDFFRARRSGDPPEYLTAMERIRHLGVRLILATQQPNYLDAHLRGLVGMHEHMVREEGKESAVIYRHNEVIEDVRSERARARHDKETWAFPKENYGLYESAEVHTVKRTFKSRVKRGWVMGGIAVVLAAVGVLYLKGIFLPDAAASAGEGGGPAAVIADRSGKAEKEPLDAEAWAARFVPRVAEMPMSAPAFDDRPVVSQPRIACAIGESMGCVCLTEQGTRYRIDLVQCVRLVQEGGVYDPFREPPQEGSRYQPDEAAERGAGGTPAVTPSPVGVGEAEEIQAAYGAFRG